MAEPHFIETFGPNPWQQQSWDWRAAGNFIGGGAGSGLIVFAALAQAAGPARTALLLAGLALVGVGLGCVSLEIGRPLRALNVFINPRTSWMSREAYVGVGLFAAGLAAAAEVQGTAVLVAMLALLFAFCQGNILRAARGIPAWREPLTVPLLMSTALAEGGGLFWMAEATQGSGDALPALLFGAALLARWVLWLAWRRRIAASAAPRALVAIDAAGRIFKAASLLPLAIVMLVLMAAHGDGWVLALQAAAGLLTLGSGAWFKFTLVTRGAFNQGFALVHLPVRGVRR